MLAGSGCCAACSKSGPAWPNPDGTFAATLVWPATMWPAAKADPPQLIGLPGLARVAELICAAQLAERATTWRQPHSLPR